jgi:hypothetical protein
VVRTRKRGSREKQDSRGTPAQRGVLTILSKVQGPGCGWQSPGARNRSLVRVADSSCGRSGSSRGESGSSSARSRSCRAGSGSSGAASASWSTGSTASCRKKSYSCKREDASCSMEDSSRVWADELCGRPGHLCAHPCVCATILRAGAGVQAICARGRRLVRASGRSVRLADDLCARPSRKCEQKIAGADFGTVFLGRYGGVEGTTEHTENAERFEPCGGRGEAKANCSEGEMKPQ